MDNPAVIVNALTDVVKPDEDEASLLANVSPSKVSFDEDLDGVFNEAELKNIKKHELTIMQRMQRKVIKYAFIDYKEKGDLPDDRVNELIDEVITIEHSSTARPKPSVKDKAIAKAIDSMPMIIIAVFFWLAVQVMPAILG